MNRASSHTHIVLDTKFEKYVVGCMLEGTTIDPSRALRMVQCDGDIVIMAKYGMVRCLALYLVDHIQNYFEPFHTRALLYALDYGHQEFLDMLTDHMWNTIHTRDIGLLDHIKQLAHKGIFVTNHWCSTTSCLNLAENTGATGGGYHYKKVDATTTCWGGGVYPVRSKRARYAMYMPENMACGALCADCAHDFIRILSTGHNISVCRDMAKMIVSFV